MNLNEIDLNETWDLNITRTSNSFLIDFDVRWHLYISLYLSTTQRYNGSTEWFKMKFFWSPSDSSIIWIVMKITLLEVWMITVSYRSCVASHTWSCDDKLWMNVVHLHHWVSSWWIYGINQGSFWQRYLWLIAGWMLAWLYE